MPMTLEASRTRGHKKRARTRHQLLDAALEVLRDSGESFTVAEIAARAGVSHGTFYNYFKDRDELMEALVLHVVSTFASRMTEEVTDEDPALRFARISARALETAQREPLLVQAGIRVEAVHRQLFAEGPLDHLRHDLAEGYATGRFTSPPDDGTLDTVTGTLLLASRRISGGEDSPAYRCSILERLLQALGITQDEASSLAERALR